MQVIEKQNILPTIKMFYLFTGKMCVCFLHNDDILYFTLKEVDFVISIFIVELGIK